MNTATSIFRGSTFFDTRKLLFAVAAFLAFNALIATAWWRDREAAELKALIQTHFAEETQPDRSRPLNAAERKLAQSMAAAQPHQQAFLYLLYRDAEARKDKTDADAYAALMAQLGWRDTNTQRSLLIRAANARRFDDLLNRADAMLRRDVLVDQAMQLVFLFELNADVRAPLVRALRRMPSWRSEFFAQANILQDPRHRLARIDTVTHLLDSGAKLSRAEMAPLVNALDRAGELRQAEVLWARFAKPTTRSILQDPLFADAAKQDTNRPDLVMPFEWHFEQGTGYSAYVDSTGGTAVEWDGHGVPVFLWQRLRVGRGQPVKLSVNLDSDVMTASPALNVTLVCDGGRVVVPLDRKDIDAGRDRIIFSGGSAPCDLPALRLSGALRDTVSPADFTIREIQAGKI